MLLRCWCVDAARHHRRAVVRGAPGAGKVRPRVLFHKSGTRSKANSGRSPDYGTLVTSTIALLIGVHVSFGIALFLTENVRRSSSALGTASSSLRRFPRSFTAMGPVRVRASVRRLRTSRCCKKSSAPLDTGPCIQRGPNGIGMLSDGIILSVMVIPFISAVMRDVFEIVPPGAQGIAYGIGARPGKWCAMWCFLTPKSRVIGGIMLGGPRARRDHGGDLHHR